MKKSISSLSKSYAKSLMMLGGSPEEKLQFVTQLDTLIQILDKKTLELLSSPKMPESVKFEIINTLSTKLDFSPKIQNMLKAMVEYKRLNILHEISTYCSEYSDDVNNILRVHIKLANEQQKTLVDEIKMMMEKVFNKKVIMEMDVDSSLQAGFVVQFGSVTLDASLKFQIQKLTRNLFN